MNEGHIALSFKLGVDSEGISTFYRIIELSASPSSEAVAKR